MPENIVAIIQARLGSSRLPLKSLLCLREKPVIDWVVDRVASAREIHRVIVAVPDTELDRALADHLERKGVECMAGPENDVLKRFCLAAKKTGATHIVRVCADNPLIWPDAIDRLARFYKKEACDYAYNHIPRQNLWPDGLGAEIISRSLLDQLDKEAEKPAQREHCFNYIWDNAEKFRIATFDPEEEWLRRPDLKLDLDSANDFLRLSLLPITPDMDARAIVNACDNA